MNSMHTNENRNRDDWLWKVKKNDVLNIGRSKFSSEYIKI